MYKEFNHNDSQVVINRAKKQLNYGGFAKSNYDYSIIIDGDSSLIKATFSSYNRAKKEALRTIDGLVRKSTNNPKSKKETFIFEEYDFDGNF